MKSTAEPASINLDSDMGVIALVPDHWQSDKITTRHHVMSRLAQRCPSVWMEPIVNWTQYLRRPRLAASGRRYETSSGLTVWPGNVLNPGFSRPEFLARQLERRRLMAARRYLIARGARRVVLYVWRPEFSGALDSGACDACVYHIDDEYSFSETEVATSEREAGLIRRSDAVIVHSDALLEKKRPYNSRMFLISNGVDYKAYSTPQREPDDMQSIGRPRIGYVGVIKRQLDFELLCRAAERRPDWSFVFVGPVGFLGDSAVHVDRLRALRNCHFLGARDMQSLPGYVQSMDVCLLSYLVNDYTKYINPLKLYEYLASGRPAVGTPIRPILRHGDILLTAGDCDELIRQVETCLASEEDSELMRERRRAYASQYDWENIVDSIVDVMRGALLRTSGSARESGTA